ncbi:unnamed protein product [Rodentolepis nana]|uniref:MFS domain-containing protein n=1 Tax=Rodentolepis nana TaxID=102285 RepID=A0A0R3TUY4_RODNA|nr:unnamed protein product [Rodentolepis nana]
MGGHSESSELDVVKPYQDRGWAWVVMCSAFLVHFLTAGCEKAFSLWYIEILEVFGTNSATAASLGGFSAAVRLVLAPITVMLCTKFTIQYVVMAGGLLSCIGMIIAARTTSIWGLYVGFGVIYGLGLTLVFTPALIVCTIYFERRRATALSLSLAGAGFGAFFIPQLITYLLQIYGYRGAMLLMAGIVLNYVVSGAIFFTPIEEKVEKTEDTTIALEKPASFLARIKSSFIFLELLRDGWFMLFISSFIFNMMGSGPVTNLILHYAEELGTNVKVSVFLFAIEGGVQIFARSLSGLLFDQKLIKKYRGIVWCADIILSATIVCLFAAATNFITLCILMGFRGLFLAIYISHQTLMTCDMHNKPKDSGLLPHAIGMTQFSKGIGILLGSMISGKQIYFFT